jgi:DNA replicative helicase MCM subunit Mcm2 (Cdc46/Mcm family)
LRVLETRLRSGHAICPKCKRGLDPFKSETSDLSAADTQTINIQEMARMAQEGIEIEISGEWNTAEPNQEAKKE